MGGIPPLFLKKKKKKMKLKFVDLIEAVRARY